MKPLTKAQRAVLEKMAEGYLFYVIRHHRPYRVTGYLWHDKDGFPVVRGIRGATVRCLDNLGYIEPNEQDPLWVYSWQITDAGRKEVKASEPD